MVRLFSCATGVVVIGAPAVGGMINIGGGWQASWDASLDPFVSITPLSVGPDAVFIKKTAEFTQGPQIGGLFPAIPIVFTQTDPGAVGSIVIEEEEITNSTGVEWTDFHFEILDGNDAFFDPAATAASGGPGPIGFDVAPFTQASFSDNDQVLDVLGGVVPDGAVWRPGDDAAGDGALWLTLNTGDGASTPFTTFTLKETPTPTPGSLALVGLAGLACLRRGR